MQRLLKIQQRETSKTYDNKDQGMEKHFYNNKVNQPVLAAISCCKFAAH